MGKQNGNRRHWYMVFAIIWLICCWESNLDSSTIFASGIGSVQDKGAIGEMIPQESIRLRILANSDSPADQWIKREVRDAIVQEMQQWVNEPQGIEAARDAVRMHLPEIGQLVGDTLQRYGFDSAYQVELGQVAFPAKMYGSQIYPAGEYEALKVSIGSADGQNWWCVLFPPLCFVDAEMIARKPDELDAKAGSARSQAGQKPASAERLESNTTAKPSKQAEDNGKALAAKPVNSTNSINPEKAGQSTNTTAIHANENKSLPQPEVRFFLWDFLVKLFA
ncbi:stage II sporulation protein R [Paenibacillus agricola]|uniref:Stage II sporulation protein R n=1 Tax=Paenibacillus agricola TaxID=2716264 RepID=A0ABX0JCA4_9BACL|nr:stage II sporulation protein R [Paenibacillus agricola]NHN33797.1 stage II sporulation protein R [Paenibacillus agricola]